jgi:uncharacterized protein YdcH (DUF465 family)
MNESKFDPREAGNMSAEEYEIAMRLTESDPEFKRLWEEHRELKRRLNDLQAKPFRSAEDEVEIKRMKRLKLQGKDRIAEKIREFKVGVVPPE